LSQVDCRARRRPFSRSARELPIPPLLGLGAATQSGSYVASRAAIGEKPKWACKQPDS
jgi:hypothetical protein